jgi:hypothetical protein
MYNFSPFVFFFNDETFILKIIFYKMLNINLHSVHICSEQIIYVSIQHEAILMSKLLWHVVIVIISQPALMTRNPSIPQDLEMSSEDNGMFLPKSCDILLINCKHKKFSINIKPWNDGHNLCHCLCIIFLHLSFFSMMKHLFWKLYSIKC